MLFNRVLFELKGRFTANELCFLVEAFKETKLSAQLAGQQLKIYCDDAMLFRNLDQKWPVERKAFFQKVEEIPSFQTASLEVWARMYWFRKWNKGEKVLKDYVSALL